MPSSTSSSNDRIPEGPWGRTWLLAGLLTVLLLGCWEMGWRARGFRPSVADDETAWVAARAQVSPGSVVFLGTSRIQTALDPKIWREEWDGQEPVELAMFAGSPIPILDDLAEDSTYRGLVVLDLVPRIVFDATFEREIFPRQRVRAYREILESPSRWTEVRLRMLGSSRFVFRDPVLSPRRVLESVLDGEVPSPPYATMRKDRFMALDFSRSDTSELFENLYSIAESHGRPASPAEMDLILSRIEADVEKIRDRGGEVVFVLMPRCGEIRAIEDARYPRDVYWDVFIQKTAGLTLNAQDDPTLNRYDCPDGSHIDVRDTEAFTADLARAVARSLGARAFLGNADPQ